MADAQEEEPCPVVTAWMAMPVLVAKGGQGHIATVKQKLDRQDVSDNADLLEPLIRSFGLVVGTYPVMHCMIHCMLVIGSGSSLFRGTRVSIQQMQDVAGRFLYLTRPRGKRLPSSVLTII